MTDQGKGYPIVSVVIPCYNHAHYLPESIASVLQQDYPAVEIIVVDDGSSDNTREVAQSYEKVKYVYQANSGLSAARNTGIKNSTGEYIVFLDADDWLTPGSIQRNLQYLLNDDKLAFVSGAHYKVYMDTSEVEEVKKQVLSDHYLHLLESNYVAMTASVMFRHWVFKEFLFDTTLKACEDYDIFFKIARKYPVVHHLEHIGAYRIHNSNMSGNMLLMLSSVLKVLERQLKHLRTNEEVLAYDKGKQTWIDFYLPAFYQQLLEKRFVPSKTALITLYKCNPSLAREYILSNKEYVFKTLANNYTQSLRYKLSLLKN